MDKIWNELLQFETRDLIKRYVQCKHGRDLNENRVLQISSNFIQAREYFRNAMNSDFSVKPLLLYYGVMSLSKGLILTLDLKKTEEQLKSSHGLKIKNWSTVFKNFDYENLEITVGNGTFSELLNITENANYLKFNSSAIDWKTTLKKPNSGDVLTLKQLVQYFPDLDNEFFSWTQERLFFAPIEELKTINDHYCIKMDGIIDERKIEKLFPSEYCPTKKIEIVGSQTILEYKIDKWFPNFTQKMFQFDNIGISCIIPTLPNDIGINILGSMYMLSYFLGMMARYYPTNWMSLMRVNKGDRFYPFAYNALNYIEEEFPKQVLIFLKSPYDFENK